MERLVKFQATEVMVKSYQPKVEVLWATPNPQEHVTAACTTTQKGVFAGAQTSMLSQNISPLIAYIIKASHTSPLEHAVISFRLTNMSRATLDQLVRHRIGSFTASSTHYQNHANYEHFIDLRSFPNKEFLEGIARSVLIYSQMSEYDPPQARQILPLSVGVACIWTVNARSLLNFLNLRMCMRNTVEMVLLARQVRAKLESWFTELWHYGTTDCIHGKCKQGKMRCDFSAALDIVQEHAIEY